MLSDESFLVQQIEDQAKFINKHVLYEFFNFIKNEGYYIKENFTQFNQKIKKGFKSNDILWNIFTPDNLGVKKQDFTFPLKA